MRRDKRQEAHGVSADVDDPHAVFIGWQETAAGDTFALYNITLTGHPLRGSTVTDRRLLELKLRIPRTPGRAVNRLICRSVGGRPDTETGEVHEK